MDLKTFVCAKWRLSVQLFAFLLCVVCQLAEAVSEGETIVATTLDPTSANISTTVTVKNRPMHISVKGVTFRAIYVIAAVSGIIIVYFIAKAICNRRRNNRTRRYGILNDESRDNMEMRPLSEQDDDDEDDLTLFDMSKRKGKR
ncbi:uncharacterized protein LOC135693753 isoform X2 [Rhopilema esculentum]|uniref:uncharacterized protein LOC135693753 isoform X2 n=1 Tax=Rhopilema esculentum TaxID=499914 RepID=UPI0031D50878